MTTASEILTYALALPPSERASIASSLLQSLPDGPRVYRTEGELLAEVERRIHEVESGAMETFDAADTLRRAREAVARSRD